MSVEFQDFSIQVKEALDDKALIFLEEAASEIESAAKRGSRVDSGQLKGSWAHLVDEGVMKLQLEARCKMPFGKSLAPANMLLTETAEKAAGRIKMMRVTGIIREVKRLTERFRAPLKAGKPLSSAWQNKYSGSWGNDNKTA